MISPNQITFSRLIISIILIVLMSFESFLNPYLFIIILISLFIIGEFTDFIDGYIARKYKITSDIGKVLDPYADVIQHMIYFIFLFKEQIAPFLFIVIFLYREISITFLRILMIKYNVVQAANLLGKIKTVFYAITTLVSLIYYSLIKLKIEFNFLNEIDLTTKTLYLISTILAIVSFLEYVKIFLKIVKEKA